MLGAILRRLNKNINIVWPRKLAEANKWSRRIGKFELQRNENVDRGRVHEEAGTRRPRRIKHSRKKRKPALAKTQNANWKHDKQQKTLFSFHWENERALEIN